MKKEILQKIITETFIEAASEKSEKDNDDIPTSLQFHGKWIKPDEKHIEDQIKLAACLYGTSYEEIVNKLSSSKTAILTKKIWASLDNTLSWHVTDADKAKNIADEYGYHYNDAMFGYMNNRDVTMPVIIYKSGKKPYVVSGETELLFASAFKINPKVIIISL